MAPSLERHFLDEILDYIVSLVDRETLPSLCITSKTLYRLATPHLYSHVKLTEDIELGFLAYLLVASPAHASYVRSLVVPKGWELQADTTGKRKPWIKTGTPQDEENMLRRECARYAMNDNQADELYHRIKSCDNEDAVLAFMIARLPNLQRLDIDFGMLDHHNDFHEVLRLVADNVTSSPHQSIGPLYKALESDHLCQSVIFSKPLHILIKGTDDKYPNDSGHVATWFHLPNLHSFYACKFGDSEMDLEDDETTPFKNLKPHSCPVEHIELRTSKLHSVNLRLLLNATIPGKLKTFIYEIGCTWAFCNVEHPAIMQSLAAHHDTLENLSLSHEEYYPYQAQDDDSLDRPDPCSFTSFRALKRLRVAPAMVWGHNDFDDESKWSETSTRDVLWRALPQSLEELWIARAHQEALPDDETQAYFIPDCLLPALHSLLQHKNESCPSLTQITIEFPAVSWKYEWLEALAAFCQKASAAGIRDIILSVGLGFTAGDSDIERGWGWNEDVTWEECFENTEAPKVHICVDEDVDVAEELRSAKDRPEKQRMDWERKKGRS